MTYLVLMLLAIAAAWWWTSRVEVTPPPVAMMTTRIAFGPGIRLHDATQALARIDNPEEIVIPFEQAVLVIEYPLSRPAEIEITAPMPLGFTRSSLVKAICDEYASIYDAEEGTSATKTIPLDERGDQPQRNRTDGAYGIWGHDLRDLVMTAARWTRDANGRVLVELHVIPATTSR